MAAKLLIKNEPNTISTNYFAYFGDVLLEVLEVFRWRFWRHFVGGAVPAQKSGHEKY
ncbi:MAG: hypothetical protein KBT67_06850 [bacterium]|nr:hypothetical protein [Candidatus Limimorpha caballi]